MLLRRLAGRDGFVGVFIFEFIEREAAGLHDFEAARNRFRIGGEKPRHLVRRFEMTLGIDLEPEARFGKGAFLADAGEDIGEAAALRQMIERVIDGDEWCGALRGQFGENP